MKNTNEKIKELEFMEPKKSRVLKNILCILTILIGIITVSDFYPLIIIEWNIHEKITIRGIDAWILFALPIIIIIIISIFSLLRRRKNINEISNRKEYIVNLLLSGIMIPMNLFYMSLTSLYDENKDNGNIFSNSFLTIKRKISLEEKLEWLAKVKEKVSLDPKYWDEIIKKINLEKITSLEELVEQVNLEIKILKIYINHNKNGFLKLLDNLRESLSNLWEIVQAHPLLIIGTLTLGVYLYMHAPIIYNLSKKQLTLIKEWFEIRQELPKFDHLLEEIVTKIETFKKELLNAQQSNDLSKIFDILVQHKANIEEIQYNHVLLTNDSINQHLTNLKEVIHVLLNEHKTTIDSMYMTYNYLHYIPNINDTINILSDLVNRFI